MKTDQLSDLRALRVLREQRAARELAQQQQHCRTVESQRDQARRQLHEHRLALAAEAEALYGSFAESLPVNAWREAQAQLQQLEQRRDALQSDLGDIEQTLHQQHLQREQMRQQRLRCQQQVEVCEDLLQRQQQAQSLRREQGEEADAPAALPDARS